MRILLTGFGRFPGAPTNPSAAIVAAIAHAGRRRLERCGITITTAVLPVEFDGIAENLTKHLAATEPDAVLHLGLAGRRFRLTVETRAKNRISQLRPDAAKRRPGQATVLAGAPEHRNVRPPVMRLAVAMGRAGAPTRLSNDAGAYICNATLYLSLGAATPLVGFVHVPWPRPAGRPLARRRAGPEQPSFAAMVAAITAALLLIGAQARRIRHRRPDGGHMRPSGHALTDGQAQP